MSSQAISSKRPILAPPVKAALGCAICIVLGLIPLFMGAFPVFLGPVSAEFHWGLSTFPQAPMIVGLSAAVTGPFIGRLFDRKGVRAILPVGLGLWAIGLFALSLMDGSLWRLYLIAAVLGVGGAIAGPIAYAKVINGWFDRNRGLALALVMSGAPALATAIAVQVSQGLVDLQGWRAAYRVLAVVAATITIPACLLLVREAPSQEHTPGAAGVDVPGLTGAEAFRSRDFVLVVGVSALAIGALMGVSNHFLAWMGERGVGKETATLALSLFSLAAPLGPLAGGLLVDRVSNSKIISGFFALAPAGMALLFFGGAFGVWTGMMLLGLAFSSITGFAPYLVSRYFGMRAASEILAVTFAVLTIGMGLGPVLVGLGHDLTASYSQPMGLAAGVALLASFAALFFQPYRYGAPLRP